MNATTKERVGIVGAGRMGHAMLKHLVKHGYQVTACDLSAEALAKAREAGAATANSPAALAKVSDFVILGVGYTDEVHAVVYGDERAAREPRQRLDHRGVIDDLALRGAGDREGGEAQGHRRARRSDLSRPFRGR